MTPRGIFEHLEGVWTFERTIQSASGNRMGSVQGVACFKPQTPELDPRVGELRRPTGRGDDDAFVLHYQEEGQWMDGLDHTLARRLKAYREYLYCYQPESDSIEKHFSENGYDHGLFYPLSFNRGSTGLVAQGAHRCALDQYQATYRYAVDDKDHLKRIDLEYKVSGPKKGYIATTVFVRS